MTLALWIVGILAFGAISLLGWALCAVASREAEREREEAWERMHQLAESCAEVRVLRREYPDTYADALERR